MTLQEFITLYNNQHGVGDTNENEGQCVGLVEKWIDNLKLAHIWGNAKDLFANADRNFYEAIANDPNNVPEAGDIIVWNDKEGNGNGHCSIADTADVYHLISFDQNWIPGSACQLVRHDYANIIGWLHPKQNQTTLEDQLADANKLKDQYYDQLQTALHQISDLEEQVKQLQNQLNSPKSTIGNVASFITTSLMNLKLIS